MSKAQEKILKKKIEQEEYILKSKEQRATERWEDAQIKAATAQSVLDYAIQQYEEHKDELEEEIIKQTEEQIAARKAQIHDYIMSEKDLYLETMGIQAD